VFKSSILQLIFVPSMGTIALSQDDGAFDETRKPITGILTHSTKSRRKPNIRNEVCVK
jgi:hypothetical protein